MNSQKNIAAAANAPLVGPPITRRNVVALVRALGAAITDALEQAHDLNQILNGESHDLDAIITRLEEAHYDATTILPHNVHNAIPDAWDRDEPEAPAPAEDAEVRINPAATTQPQPA
jgi:hypothetical protein